MLSSWHAFLPLTLHPPLQGFSPRFADEETERQRGGGVTCPRSHVVTGAKASIRACLTLQPTAPAVFVGEGEGHGDGTKHMA